LVEQAPSAKAAASNAGLKRYDLAKECMNRAPRDPNWSRLVRRRGRCDKGSRVVNGAIGRPLLRVGHCLGPSLSLCDYLLYFVCPIGGQTARLKGPICRAQGFLTSRTSAKSGLLRIGTPRVWPPSDPAVGSFPPWCR
jgi:hypothetical protein